ncbi:hypothetical protein BST11_22810 [Mycobacterium alsense]|uniref:Uncharacterized protein n=1 Tax=Mycobacterium alsense TaxID=324058 RepID=A0ABX3R332_9MYCO|nr:hypothetical protein BST11_22810 [Mycobacterium alsense]
MPNHSAAVNTQFDLRCPNHRCQVRVVVRDYPRLAEVFTTLTAAGIDVATLLDLNRALQHTAGDAS